MYLQIFSCVIIYLTDRETVKTNTNLKHASNIWALLTKTILQRIVVQENNTSFTMRLSTTESAELAKLKAREVFILITIKLANDRVIFDQINREKFLQNFAIFEHTNIRKEVTVKGTEQENRAKKAELTRVEGSSSKKMTSSSHLPLETWINLLQSPNCSTTFPCVTIKNFQLVAPRTLKLYDPISLYKGNVMRTDEGHQIAQRYGRNYIGSIIFNLGAEWNFQWYDVRHYIHLPENQISYSGTSTNCELYVLNCSEKPVPLIYATSVIAEGERLFISYDNLSKLNAEFVLWSTRNNSTRKSLRVKNLEVHLEEVYVHHLYASTEYGIEKKLAGGEKGYGVFTTKIFRDKDFIVEYKGELIEKNEGERRFKEFSVERGSYFFELGKSFSNQWIDATDTIENIGRYVNHSSKAYNCKALCRYLDGRPRLFFVASGDIATGFELLYDYNDRKTDLPFLKQ